MNRDNRSQLQTQEIHMHTQIAPKIAALTAALLLNGLIMVGVAHLFDGQSHPQVGLIASTHATAQSAREAT